MEGHECHITFYDESSKEGSIVVGYLHAPFPPDVNDIVHIPGSTDTWRVTRRKFMWPSPGSVNYQAGGRYPIMDIFVIRDDPFFE